jgi:alpha-1,2-mannosyltransferase
LLYWGQLSLVLLLVVFLDLFVVPARYRGLLLGAATAVKLLPALFVVWLLARRELSAVVRVVAAFVVLTLVAAAIWPHASVQYWFHILPSGKDVLMVADPTNIPTSHGRWYFGVGKPDNQSLRGLLARPPFLLPGTFPWILFAIAIAALGVLVTVRILRTSRDRDLLAFLVLSATTVLISPVSWLHYWVFVGLAPFVAFLEWRRDRVITAACALLTVGVCADLEDPRLAPIYAVGRQFARIAPIEVFVLRNLYVLAGLLFLGLVAWRTLAPARAPELLERELTPATP